MLTFEDIHKAQGILDADNEQDGPFMWLYSPKIDSEVLYLFLGPCGVAVKYFSFYCIQDEMLR